MISRYIKYQNYLIVWYYQYRDTLNMEVYGSMILSKMWQRKMDEANRNLLMIKTDESNRNYPNDIVTNPEKKNGSLSLHSKIKIFLCT